MENLTSLELSFVKKEAKRIKAMELLAKLIKKHDGLTPDFITLEAKDQYKRNATQTKKALELVSKIDILVLQEAVYEPNIGTTTKIKNYCVQTKLNCKTEAEEDILFINEILGYGVQFFLHYTIEGILEERLSTFRKANSSAKLTKMAIHTVTQFYGNRKQLSLFSEEKIDAFKDATELTIQNRPKNYGVVLNQAQLQVFEGILKAFSKTNYKGHEQKTKTEAFKDTYSKSKASIETISKGKKAPYYNIENIPVVKLNQSQLIELSGFTDRQGDKQNVIEALGFLGTNQFCFYWERLQNKDGKPVKKLGNYVKEEVMEVGTLLRVKTIRNPETGLLDYYEIEPSAPVLDQIDNYFLLVPNNWREEVKRITGKRGSSYTLQFLIYLRLQYELIRRYNKNGGKKRPSKPFTISRNWEDIAIALKMPESIYKANRKRAIKIIEEAYYVAKQLGYLLKVENNGAIDMLYLNEKYYPKSGELL